MIVDHSTGYPYLACARRYGVDYGTLLAYADARRKDLLNAHDDRPGRAERERPYDCWEVRAIRTLSKFPTITWIDRDVTRLMRQTLADKGVKL